MVFRGFLVLLDDVEGLRFAVAGEVFPEGVLLRWDIVSQCVYGIWMVISSFWPCGRALHVDDFVVESGLWSVLGKLLEHWDVPVVDPGWFPVAGHLEGECAGCGGGRVCVSVVAGIWR